MKLDRVSKMAILMTLIIVATSCLEKSDHLNINANMAENKTAWQWDDQRKTWLYNGSVYTPKPDSSSRSVWKKQERSLIFRVESAKSLTAFDNAPNALQMKVFQLSDPKAFLQAATSSPSLKHLLVSEKVDPAVVGMERLFVLPGVSQTINLERKENARYIGIILGYANSKPEKIFRLVPIITLDDSTGNNKEVGTMLAANTQSTLRAATLKMNLHLENDGIDKLDVDAR